MASAPNAVAKGSPAFEMTVEEGAGDGERFVLWQRLLGAEGAVDDLIESFGRRRERLTLVRKAGQGIDLVDHVIGRDANLLAEILPLHLVSSRSARNSALRLNRREGMC